MLDPGQKKKGGYKTGLSGANLDGYIRGKILERNHAKRMPPVPWPTPPKRSGPKPAPWKPPRRKKGGNFI